MPTLDVSDILSDPLFVEPLTIYRRTESIGNNGRNTITATLISPAPVGSVQPKDSVIGGNAIERAPDAEYRGSALLCYTQFKLRGPSDNPAQDGTTFQPDVLMWNGDTYIVTLINDYSHYGAGYIQAELSSIVLLDLPPMDGFNG